jgi:transmembrane sensor
MVWEIAITMHTDDFGAQRGHDEDAIPQAAARWLARLDRGLSAAEKAELERWKAADQRHASELARMELTWREYDWARSAPELVAMADEANRASDKGSRRPMGAWKPALAAAAAMTVLIAGLAWWNVSTPKKLELAPAATYRVIASAANRMVLDDGSVVDVREGGDVRAEFTATERRVRLVRGEAHFTVAPDAAKPFVVLVGDTRVRAVGTAFNVRLETGRVEVLVTEGKVQVADGAALESAGTQRPPLVTAGERAIVERDLRSVAAATTANIAVAPAAPGEMEKALAWNSTRLVFDRTPLDEAVEAFNRHSESGSRVKLVIGDASLRTRRLGGTIRAANVDGFVRLLEQSVEVRTEHRGHEIVLLPAP